MPTSTTLSVNKRGFTLIELMIAMTILAVVSAIGYTSYSNAQIAARDFRRKDDLRKIQVALELYQQKNGRYPCSDDSIATWLTSSANGFWITDALVCSGSASARLDSTYINQMPQDPSGYTGNPATTNNVFGYVYRSDSALSGLSPCPTSPTGGKYYFLVAALENTADPDRNGATPKYTDCTGAAITNNPNAFVLTNP